MRSLAAVGFPVPGQAPVVEVLAVTADALAAHARLLAIEGAPAQVAQLVFAPSIMPTHTLTLQDEVSAQLLTGPVLVIEHLIDQGLAVTRLELAPYP